MNPATTQSAELKKHDIARDKAQAIYEQGVIEAAKKAQTEKDKKKREEEILILLLFFGEQAYLEAYHVLGFPPDEIQVHEQALNFARARRDGFLSFAAIISGVIGFVQSDPYIDHLTAAARLRAIQTLAKKDSAIFASTEAQIVYGAVQFDILKRMGVAHKRWQTQEDERVRLSHVECQRQGALVLNEKFHNGLEYPGDPSGSLREIIGCRCYLLPAE